MPPLCVCASVDHAVYGVRRLVRGAADYAGSVVRGAGHRAPPIRLGRAAASGDSRRGRAEKQVFPAVSRIFPQIFGQTSDKSRGKVVVSNER